MGILTECARWLWSGAKRAAAFAWSNGIKPAATKLLSWLGVAHETIVRGCDAVETAAKKVVSVLETNLGDLVRTALDRLEQRLERWLAERHGRLGTVIRAALERLRELLGVDERIQDDVFTVVRPSVVTRHASRDLEK